MVARSQVETNFLGDLLPNRRRDAREHVARPDACCRRRRAAARDGRGQATKERLPAKLRE